MAETKKRKKIVSVYISFYYRLFKVIGWIVSFILVLMVIVGMVIIVAEKAGLGGYSAYVVESESMLPTIKKGDTVVVQHQDNYSEKDIITFYPSKDAQKTYTHRIVSVDSKSSPVKYTTRGDNNSVDDPFKVTQDNIQGKVVQIVPGVGDLVLFMRSVTGIIVFIIIPATMFLTLNLQSIYNWLKKSYHENKAY